MSMPPDLGRRRVVIGALALLLLAMAQRETPLIGSVTISTDGAHAPVVSAVAAPMLRSVAAVAMRLGELLVR
ncbi:hypothetical protein ACMGDM_18265 [Sphingomonas sp. DT-51]|uniref:hypothetical protein n=1 Tax=Sphingomonas sp. DT-51 TaxID=3396165 RepID=UPI003F198AFC